LGQLNEKRKLGVDCPELLVTRIMEVKSHGKDVYSQDVGESKQSALACLNIAIILQARGATSA
jgi:hypothetical protein